ncbi:MAG: hypothetical protein N2200_07960 [Bacteroidia bacterium]|nr:hypothetical protein [Bacteroidia bacterium]
MWKALISSLLWAQSAGVWHWHHHANTGQASPTVGWVGLDGPNFRSIPGKMQVVGDTVYTIGTVSHAGSSTGLVLPGGPSLTAPAGNIVTAYIAAYVRSSGSFLWAVHFRPQNGGATRIRGIELLVSENHTVYAILHAQSPGINDNLSAEYFILSNPSASATLVGNALIESYPLSFIVRFHPSSLGNIQIQRLGCGQTGLGSPPCSSGNFEANFFSLLLHAGKLWVSGTVLTNTNLLGSTYLEPAAAISPGLLTALANLIGGLLTSGTSLQAVLLRLDPTTLSVDSASSVQSGANSGSHPSCYGRALFAYGPDTVGWIVALRETGNKRYKVVGSASHTTMPGTPALQALLIHAPTMAAHPASITAGALANYASSGSSAAPPHYQIAFQRSGSSGGELFWATADTAYYSIQGTPYPPHTEPRLLLSRAHITAIGVANRVVVYTPPTPGLQLSGVAIEPRVNPLFSTAEPYIYLSGTVSSASLTIVGVPGSTSIILPGSPLNQPCGFVLGLQWKSTSISWRFRGYKPLLSVSKNATQHAVVSAGIARHPTHPQLYLYGWARDSMLVEPLWPTGQADTIRPAPLVSHPPRLWIGRLDLYRLSNTSGLSSISNQCTPDTVFQSQSLEIVGTWTSTIPRDLVWMPADQTRTYQAKQRWAAIIANPIGASSAFQEGRVTASFPLLAPGRLPPGRYFLSLRSPVMGNRFADIGDTLWIDVTGTTTPQLQRAGALRWNRMVVRFAGSRLASTPLAETATQPFYRKDRRFSQINRMVYLPWDGWAGGKEVIYALETTTSNSLRLYRLDLSTGLFTPLRSWTTSTSDPAYRGVSLFGDTKRGALWNVINNRLFWRLDTTDAAKDDSLPLYRAGVSFSPGGVTTTGGYPLNSDQPWTNLIGSVTCTSNGDIVFFAQHRISSSQTRWVLVRVSPEKDSSFIVAGGGNLACPQDGVGSGVTLSGDFSRITSYGDTLYWVERSGTSCTNARRILRKAWPTTIERRTYQVQTIDTLDGSTDSDYYDVHFISVPSPGLYMNSIRGTERFMLWYNILNRQRDTILACLHSSCCEYDLSDFVRPDPPPFPYVVLRSGIILYRTGGGGEIRAILPIQISSQGDTLRAEASIQQVSFGSFSQDTLYIMPTTDSTRLQVSTCGLGSPGKTFWYGRYLFPSVTVNIVAPDTVCEGMTFHSYLLRSSIPEEEGCQIASRLMRVSSQQSLLQNITNNFKHTHRWKAVGNGHDTLRLSLLRERWRWLFASLDNEHPLRIRRGHRAQMQIALEGPWHSQPGQVLWMRRHPFLTRNHLAFYNEGTNGISVDSLWHLPRPRGDSIPETWNLALGPPSLTCPSDPPPIDLMCFPNWTQIARVEVRDATNDQLIDSAYALIDTLGRLYTYRAPIGPSGLMISDADTLSFCLCDTIVPKYFVIRTPNHLPLYTQTLSLPARGIGTADNIDLTDPSFLRGVPGVHYTLLPDSSLSPPRMRAGVWAGNLADIQNSFIPGAHYDSGVINAADWEFLIPRNGVTTGFSWADLDSDGNVNAADAILLLQNQNELRQSVGP